MSKRIVICCDGTWNSPDEMERGVSCATNVAKIARLVAPQDAQGVSQVVFYDEGVGTGDLADKIVGGTFGVGLSKNVCDAYRFLVNNYSNGDDLFFFGFSRGAYTVRSLAGLIRNSGLLKKQHSDQIPLAYQMYRDRSDDTHPTAGLAAVFKQRFSREPQIRFLGVWDTVGSLGIPDHLLSKLLDDRWNFHDVRLSSSVLHACQALAIDEKRCDFKPCVWDLPNGGLQPGHTLEQVWFAGVHSDIGGGYPESGLSDIALSWMKDKAASHGLEMEATALSPDCRATLHESRNSLFKLRPEYPRPLAPAFIHMSADERKKDSATAYAPENWPGHYEVVQA